jgi:hypothetical protein
LANGCSGKAVTLELAPGVEDVGSFIIDLDKQFGFNKENFLALLG